MSNKFKDELKSLVKEDEIIEEISLEDMSSLRISYDEQIANQDARKVEFSNKDGEYKRNGDLFLGNKDIQLPNGVYINQEEINNALYETLNNSENKEIKKVIVNDKVYSFESIEKLQEAINNSEIISISKGKENTKVDMRTMSVNDENDQMSVKGGMFLGKEDSILPNGDYRKIERLALVSKERAKLPSTPEVPKTKDKKKIPTWVKGVGLGISAAVLAPLLIDGVMHANSVLWHHSTPAIQNALHGINTFLGGLKGATYEVGKGHWTSNAGELINGDAATASLLKAYATYGINAVSTSAIGMYAKKFVSEVKDRVNGKNKGREKNSQEEMEL